MKGISCHWVWQGDEVGCDIRKTNGWRRLRLRQCKSAGLRQARLGSALGMGLEAPASQAVGSMDSFIAETKGPSTNAFSQVTAFLRHLVAQNDRLLHSVRDHCAHSETRRRSGVS
jgi:hypothetical protein